MATWKISTSSGYVLKESWIKKASESVQNKSQLPDQLDVDESELNNLFNYLTKNGYTFTVRAVEKRIVLPPTQLTSPCPNCSGTGQVGK